MRPHRRQLTRLPRPWDSLGKNTGVGCHFLLQCMKVKRKSEIAQLCPTQWPHGLQPTRLLCPWDFLGKSGVRCHHLLRVPCYISLYIVFWNLCFVPLLSVDFCATAWLRAKLLQSRPTLCDTMDCSSPGSSVHVAIPSFRGPPCSYDFIISIDINGKISPTVLFYFH